MSYLAAHREGTMKIVTGYEPISMMPSRPDWVIEAEVVEAWTFVLGEALLAIHAHIWVDPRLWGPPEHGHVSPRIGTRVRIGWDGEGVPSGCKLGPKEDPAKVARRQLEYALEDARAKERRWAREVRRLESEQPPHSSEA